MLKSMVAKKKKFRTSMKKILVVMNTMVIMTMTTSWLTIGFANTNQTHDDTNLLDQMDFNIKSRETTEGALSPLSSSTLASPSKKSIMIIATKSNGKKLIFNSIWSQLECFTEKVDKIIISSAKDNFQDEMSAFVEEVKETMPQIGSKIEVQNHWNDRYDAGLWCDALTEGNSTHKSTTLRSRISEYDQFFLINDSVMAVEPFNEFLDALERKNADLVSLNYWGDKKDGVVNGTYGTYWVESPVRAFSKKGIQVYSNHICKLGKIRWRFDCPHLKNSRYKRHRDKRCIVEKTEIDVAKYFRHDKVFGLYLGDDGNHHNWSNNFTYWKILRDEQSFPALKHSNRKVFESISRERPQDLTRCTTKLQNMENRNY